MLRYILNKYVLGFITLTVLALVLISYTGVDRASLTPIEKLVKSVSAPVQGGASYVVNGVSGTFNTIFSIGSLKDNNKELDKQVKKLEAENLQLKEYEYQNLRLRDLLQFKDSVSRNYDMIAASVIARNPSNEYKTITINRGSDDGIKKNMAVVTSLGLVGHVINVAGNSSEVLLIVDNSDKSSAVGGMIQITRTPGVVEGQGDNSEFLRMIHISKESPAREKQVVITSGLGGVFPKGIPIGRIAKVDIEANGLEKYALIRPYADFNRLEEVMVIRTVIGENVVAPTTGGGN